MIIVTLGAGKNPVKNMFGISSFPFRAGVFAEQWSISSEPTMQADLSYLLDTQQKGNGKRLGRKQLG
ncbi:MAG: hypothetical protein AB7F90_09095 [Nitrospirales bacterium]